MMEPKYSKLCMSVLLLMAAAGCDAGHGKRLTRGALDCGRADEAVCAMVNSIGTRLPELARRETLLPYGEQVALDVAAVFRGMQMPSVHPNTDLLNTVP
jgi:hypothetical protein